MGCCQHQRERTGSPRAEVSPPQLQRMGSQPQPQSEERRGLRLQLERHKGSGQQQQPERSSSEVDTQRAEEETVS